MTSKHYDIVLLTQREFIAPVEITPYIDNVLLEDSLLTHALEQKGLRVGRTFWDNTAFDWNSSRCYLFRAIWDYFHRFNVFQPWLKQQANTLALINPQALIEWNLDKHYLRNLQECGINIPPTRFLEQGEALNLQQLVQESGWEKAIIKPAVSGAARHTYLIDESNASAYQDTMQSLLNTEAFLFQEYQQQITSKGEVSFMVFGGRFSHAQLKKSKPGDFRVQDDFGGTLHPYTASAEEIRWVEQVVAQCQILPVYARVDVMWDNNNQLCVSELELIEPELWFRKDPNAASVMAEAVIQHLYTNKLKS